MISLIISLIALVICTIPLHELGHYIFAKRFKFSDIKIQIWKWRKFPIGFMVTGTKEITFENDKDVLEWHLRTNAFMSAGSLFSSLGFVACYLIGIFNFEFTAIMTISMLLYGIYEMSSDRGLKSVD